MLNRGEKAIEIKAVWEDMQMSGKFNVRDLWKHEDLGSLLVNQVSCAPPGPHTCMSERIEFQKRPADKNPRVYRHVLPH